MINPFEMFHMQSYLFGSAWTYLWCAAFPLPGRTAPLIAGIGLLLVALVVRV